MLLAYWVLLLHCDDIRRSIVYTTWNLDDTNVMRQLEELSVP